MKLRLAALNDLRLLLAAAVITSITWRAAGGPAAFDSLRIAPARPPVRERACAPGCPVCAVGSPAAKAALDEYLIECGMMEPE